MPRTSRLRAEVQQANTHLFLKKMDQDQIPLAFRRFAIWIHSNWAFGKLWIADQSRFGFIKKWSSHGSQVMASESGAWSETSELQQNIICWPPITKLWGCEQYGWSNSAQLGSARLCRPEPRNIAEAHLPQNELRYGWWDRKPHALAELFCQANKSGLVAADGLVWVVVS